MSHPDAAEVTRILERMCRGDARAAEEILPLLYDELHRQAARLMHGERAATTLQTTALVHEAWLRLVDRPEQESFESRAHFMRVAAQAMRRILIDQARRRNAEKRGGQRQRITLAEVASEFEDRTPDVLEIDEVLTRLAVVDEFLGRVVEMRFFAGLSVEETALALGVSEPTIVRGWRLARMWLKRALAGDEI